MGVIPERSCIRRCELIVKAALWLYHLLGEPRHPVHSVIQPDPMPMHSGRHIKFIAKSDARNLALGEAQRRTWNQPVITHQAAIRPRGTFEFDIGRTRRQFDKSVISNGVMESCHAESRSARKTS